MALPYLGTQIAVLKKTFTSNRLLALFLLLKSVAFAQSGDDKIEVGTYFKDISQYPSFKRVGSTTVNLHFAVYHLKAENNQHVLVSSKFEDDYTRANDYHLRVIDIEDINAFREEYFTLKLKGCSINGKADNSLFALVVGENKQYLSNVLKVWKVDRKTGIISSHPTTGVKCLNDNYSVAFSEF